MTTRTVTTKEELKKAKEDKVDEIVVTGKLAKDLANAQKITKLGKVAMGALTACIAAVAAATVMAPETGGASLLAVAATLGTTAATTGLNVSAILLICSLGLTVIMAIFKEYDVITLKLGPDVVIKLKKKHSS